MTAALALLLSSAYDGSLAPQHLADLRKSGLTDDTISVHKIRTVPPGMIGALVGFTMPDVRSAYLIPFPDVRGGWLDYVKIKVFDIESAATDMRGDQIETRRERWRYNAGQRKYIVRRASVPRLYVPISTMRPVLSGSAPLWVCEGMKKALAVAQLGLPAVAIESAWAWRLKGVPGLLPDFGAISLKNRIVELVPDSDVQTNPSIARSMAQLAAALRSVGARPRLVCLPAHRAEKVGIDDFIEQLSAGGAA